MSRKFRNIIGKMNNPEQKIAIFVLTVLAALLFWILT